MAVLTVRNVPDQVRDRLRMRAAQAGTSMEEQVRLILLQASLEPPPSAAARALPGWVSKLYGGHTPSGVVDELLDERRKAHRAESRMQSSSKQSSSKQSSGKQSSGKR